jgi:putative spermidine/putrescine transport system permease protein
MGATHPDIVRTVVMAALVTIGAAIAALPIVLHGQDRPPAKAVLFVAVLMPLCRVTRAQLAWRQILNSEGVVTWVAGQVNMVWLIDAILDAPVIGGSDLTTSFAGQYVVFLYIWLPYMILPIQAAFERVPNSLLEASGDLGAKQMTTF